MSKGFLSALAGLAITILAWTAPLEWPSWPATAGMWLLSEVEFDFEDQEPVRKSILVVLLITLNVATWGVIARLAVAAFDRVRRKPEM
ncbi:MAG TPA: hypothetical protein VNM92_18580 [Thermoanaerobaculia bacterium]|nr:hypothetical protein [Thermoanaerobaculia bacterium]